MSDTSSFENNPPPTPNNNSPIYALVIKDIEERSQIGMRKYGTYLQAFNGRNSLRDAYDEALDLCMYLRQKIEEEGLGSVEELDV